MPIIRVTVNWSKVIFDAAFSAADLLSVRQIRPTNRERPAIRGDWH
jgi:hypothetical protein